MRIVRIGLTGGIASGKSTIARMFVALGADLIDADLIAHQAIRKGTPAYKKIIKTFGRGCLNKQGEINRTILGKIVFDHPEKRKDLNNIVHPEVFKKESEEEKKIIKRNRNAVIVYDIPLLIETGSHLRMDKVVLVYLKRENQIKRLMRRNRLTREESMKRIRAQIPFCQKKKCADFLINGEENREKNRKKVRKIFEKIVQEYSASL